MYSAALQNVGKGKKLMIPPLYLYLLDPSKRNQEKKEFLHYPTDRQTNGAENIFLAEVKVPPWVSQSKTLSNFIFFSPLCSERHKKQKCNVQIEQKPLGW